MLVSAGDFWSDDDDDFAKVLDEVSLVTTTYNLHEIETLFKIISIGLSIRICCLWSSLYIRAGCTMYYETGGM